MNKKASVVTKGLVTGYVAGGHEVVVSRDVNETLWSGELTCLLGPNGAGKSTIIKTLSGFIPSLGGEIDVEGRDIREYRPVDLAKVVGVVLTERFHLNNMKVCELVALGRSPYTGFWGRLSSEDHAIVRESLALVGIESLSQRKVATLSDGERQKAMIAKALAQETPVIFLDEPTAFLDYPSKVEIMRLLGNLARKKEATVFLSTHDLEVALQLADRLWLVDKKLGIAAGTPEKLSFDGSVGNYFNREGVEYDPLARRFMIENKKRD